MVSTYIGLFFVSPSRRSTPQAGLWVSLRRRLQTSLNAMALRYMDSGHLLVTSTASFKIPFCPVAIY
jgi:hypothetical protein